MASGILLVVCIGLAGRIGYDSIFRGSTKSTKESRMGAPLKDRSKATVLLQPTPPGSRSKGESPDGSASNSGPSMPSRALQRVDLEELQAFVSKQEDILHRARESSQILAEEALQEGLKDALKDASNRIDSFANWYLSYPTNWKLLSLALSSAAKHSIRFRSDEEQSLSQKVSEDLQAYVCQKYEALVLKPSLTDPKLQRAMLHSLQVAHEQGYQKTLAQLQASLSEFLKEQATIHPTYEHPPQPDEVVVSLDWSAQLQKVENVPLAYEKSPTLALVGAGALVGKLAGGAATKAVASKLAAPFVSKAVAATLSGGTAAATGTAAGALAGGPLGAAAGAAIGVGVDWTVSAGVALLQKGPLVEELQDSLQATQLEWFERLVPEIYRVQKVWFDEAFQVLEDYQKLLPSASPSAKKARK